MIDKNQVLEVVRTKGYVVPSDLIREFRTDTFVMGAVLSDLVHDKKLGITSVKIGGSPAYYAIEQKEKLQDLFKYLHEKDRGTFELLRQQKVVLDTEQSPLFRVSLRAIKDYAKPIEVTANGQTYLFWKWYLATEQEINDSLRSHFSRLTAITPVSPAPPPLASYQQPVAPLQSVVQTAPLQVSAEQLVSKKAPERRQKKVAQQQPLVVPQEAPPAVLVPADDTFAQRVAVFFQTKNMQLLQFSVVKKGEIDCIVAVPTPFGSVQYYCKAKNKKKCSEGEIATAFVAGQMKKLPSLLLAPGEFPKKLLLSIDKDYPNMKLVQMEDG
ncbi:hypothetical protein HZC31_06465 [Candidatus Woesearchaeota archaeon]|nr:hypothetical protein [Candidatus Woesearchaeota archaeon]